MTVPRARRLAAVLAAGALVVGVPGAAQASAPADEPPWAELARTPVTPDMRGRATLRLVGGPLALVRDKSVRELAREAPGVTTLTSDLLFAFDSAVPAPGAAEALAGVAAALPPGAAVVVDGHTDGLGSDAVNGPLSVARAQAVADVLAAARPDLVLTVGGAGSTRPVAEEQVGGQDDPAGRALNRRVEVRVVG